MFAAGLAEYNFGDSEFLMLFLVLMTLPYAAKPELEKGSGRCVCTDPFSRCSLPRWPSPRACPFSSPEKFRSTPTKPWKA